VRFGNHAYKQHQHDSLGYLADSILLHVEAEGDWRPEYWELVRRLADFVCATWKHPGNSIWELPVVQHYLSGRVMSWVALDRAIKIAERVGGTGNFVAWQTARNEIHHDLLKNGWSERLGAFRQRYEGENLDSAALLITVMDVLPPDDPRVIATVERIADRLTINGFVYRFDPRETPGMTSTPLGEYEGAFLPCTFWLATAYARAGERHRAEAILKAAEEAAGPVGLFAEGVDGRSRTFLGNTPLVFSHTEYIRAALSLSNGSARPRREV
jgi:GH15 family glucan-1,4-alpha-glucosidase